MKTVMVKELANLMGIKPNTVYQKIWNRTMPIPARKSGRRVLFLATDVEKWLESLPRIPDDRKEVKDHEA
jgi:excisionase family DNA binding protein